MKKKLLICFSLCLFVIVFWQTLAGGFLKWCMYGFCRRHFGTELVIKDFYYKDGYWIIEKPVLEKNGADLIADRLSLGIRIYPWKRVIDIEMIVDGSSVVLGEEPTHLKEVLRYGRRFPTWLFKLKSVLEIRKGRISWVEGGKTHTAAYDVAVASDSLGVKGSLNLLLGSHDSTKNSLALKVSKEAAMPWHAELAFHALDCQQLCGMYAVFGEGIQGWKVRSGEVNGEIDVVIPEKSKPYVLGVATLRDFICEHPQMNIVGNIGETQLDIAMDPRQQNTHALLGSIQIKKGASFAFERNGIPSWNVKELVGGIYFLNDQTVTISVEGTCHHRQQTFGLLIEGDAQLAKNLSLEVVGHLHNPKGDETLVRFLAREAGVGNKEAEIELKNIGSEEYAFVQEALIPYFPECAALRMKTGRIDASGIAFLQGFHITDIILDNMKAQALEFALDPLDVSLRVGELSGNFSVNLAALDILKTVNTHFTIKKGGVQFLSFHGQPWYFHDIYTDLVIKKGNIQKSAMKGEFFGLKGTLAVDWSSPKEAMALNFSGETGQLVAFMPDKIKTGFQKSLSSHHVNLAAVMSWEPFGAKLEGEAIVSEQGKKEVDTIIFGFDLEKSSEKLWKKWPVDELTRAYWESLGLEAMKAVVPSLAFPTVLLEGNWIRSESGIAGLVMRKGWFLAKNLSLEKYLSPCVLTNDQMSLKGKGTFRGFFDHCRMAVEYEGEDVVLNNDHFTIAASTIRSVHNPEQGTKIRAVHYFDFDKGTHFGTLPLEDALYHEKTSDLIFENVHALVTFEGRKIHLSDVETKCQEIFLSGAIDVNFEFPEEGVYELDIHSHTLKGKAAQLQHILSRFDPRLMKIPIEGDISYQQGGGLLHFSFQPDTYSMQLKVNGALTNGSISFPDEGISLKNLSLNVVYDHEQSLLALSSIYGMLQCGDFQEPDVYLLAGDTVRFEGIGLAAFDIWLGDRTRDLIRLVGKTEPMISPEGKPLVVFQLDYDSTHFGDIYPAHFQLILDNWEKVACFELSFNARLDTLLRDFQNFISQDLFFLPRNIRKNIQHLTKAAGELKVSLQYKQEKGELAYEIAGEAICMNDSSFKKCLLKGRKKGTEWFLHTWQLDQMLLSGTLKQQEENWDVTRLKVDYGPSLTMVLDGIFVGKERTLHARVSQLEMDLSQVGEWPLLAPFADKCTPHGKMLGKGDLCLEFIKEAPGWKAEAILDSVLSSWDIKGMFFQDASNVSCHFISDRGVVLRNLQTGLRSPETGEEKAKIWIEKTDYGFFNNECLFDGLSFDIPSKHLPWIADTLAQSFPELIVKPIAEAIHRVKSEGHVKGSLQYEMHSPYLAIRLLLEDGRYHFFNSEHDVRHFVFEYDPFECKVSTQYLFEEIPVWMYIRSSSPTLAYGELVVTPWTFEQQEEQHQERVSIHWERGPDNGFSLRDVQGGMGGLAFQLERDAAKSLSEEAMYLVGTVNVDGYIAKKFFPDEIAKQLENWNIGQGYCLRGKWRIQKGDFLDYSDRFYFIGNLEGQDFDLKGYRFDTLTAHLEYTPHTIAVHDLNIDDVAGVLRAKEINLKKTEGRNWYFSMPQMNVERFRPSFLREAGMPRMPTKKPLIIRELVLTGCQGNLADAVSVVGEGYLRFSNRSKRLLQNTIFQIPAEILSRIGLDLSVLTPVTGTVQYTIKDGNIHLTKFKDMYSEGRLSKFNLSNSPYPSVVDFNGNLNVHVRMKQYNLLFKLAELFTFTIHGNLLRPAYSLQKQPRQEFALRNDAG